MPESTFDATIKQSVTKLLLIDFEKYLKRKFLTGSQTKIALLQVFRQSQFFQNKIDQLLSHHDDKSLESRNLRLNIYRDIVKTLNKSHIRNEFRPLGNKESYIDFFAHLFDFIKCDDSDCYRHNDEKRNFQAVWNLLLLNDHKLLSQKDHVIIRNMYLNAEAVRDLDSMEIIERVLTNAQELKISQTESQQQKVNKQSQQESNTQYTQEDNSTPSRETQQQKNPDNHDTVSHDYVNLTHKQHVDLHQQSHRVNTKKNKTCLACKELNHKFVNCRNENLVRQFWSETGKINIKNKYFRYSDTNDHANSVVTNPLESSTQ